MRCRLYHLLSLLAVATPAVQLHAQNNSGRADSARALPVVVVAEPRQRAFSAGQRLQVPDSLQRLQYRHATAADWLAEQTGVFVKTYGMGGLATPSFRGTGAAHTGIVWNGFVLNSPLNSTFDLSLLPMGLMDDVRLQFGGGTALMGSGLVGGSLLLDSRPHFDEKFTWTASAAVGSFGRAAANAQVAAGSTRFSTNTNLYFTQADNNFPFINTTMAGRPTVQQANAALRQAGGIQTLGWQWGGHMLTSSVWLQGTNRQLPSNMTDANPGTAFQHDASTRATAQYQYAGRKTIWQTRGAYIEELLHYTANPALPGGSDSRLRSYLTETEIRLALPKHFTLNTGFHLGHHLGTSSGYANGATQTRLAGFAALKYAGRKLSADASARQEWNDGRMLPLVPSLGARLQVLTWLALRGHAAAVYRMPTLNERFWQPGGNPNLLPEQGWSHDAGLEFTTNPTNVKRVVVQAQLTYFGNDINNWVLWLPVGDTLRGSFWAPQNILRVQSRGLEADVKLQMPVGNLRILLAGGYTFTQSRVAQSNNANEADKLLAYVPQHNGHATMRLTYKHTLLAYDQQLVAFRYTDLQNDDRNGFVPGYTVAGIRLAHTLQLKGLALEVFARINNLYDQAYQGIQYYPMPGRHYLFGISVSELPIP